MANIAVLSGRTPSAISCDFSGFNLKVTLLWAKILLNSGEGPSKNLVVVELIKL